MSMKTIVNLLVDANVILSFIILLFFVVFAFVCKACRVKSKGAKSFSDEIVLKLLAVLSKIKQKLM